MFSKIFQFLIAWRVLQSLNFEKLFQRLEYWERIFAELCIIPEMLFTKLLLIENFSKNHSIGVWRSYFLETMPHIQSILRKYVGVNNPMNEKKIKCIYDLNHLIHGWPWYFCSVQTRVGLEIWKQSPSILSWNFP